MMKNRGECLENILDCFIDELVREFPSWSFSVHYTPRREHVRWEIWAESNNSNATSFGGGTTVYDAKHQLMFDMKRKAR